jgi:signal transduction histidine kinase/PAS domain-containing protein/ActR/RegA family two-component response regulator
MGHRVLAKGWVYLATLAVTAAAIGLRWLLNPWIGNQMPLVTLFAAVAAGAWLGGYRTALVAMTTGWLMADFVFAGARSAAGIHGMRDPVGLAAFLLSSGVIVAMGEALRAARERENAVTREVQRLARLGSWEWRASTGRSVVSEEVLRIFGLPEGAALPPLKDQDDTLYPHDSWLRLEAAVRDAMRTGHSFHLDLEALRGGERIWVSMRGEAIQDAHGGMVGLRGTVQEITGRKRAEAFMEGQRRVLEKIARRVDLREVLADLARLVEEQDPGLLCSVHLVQDDGRTLRAGAGPSLPPDDILAMDGVSTGPPPAGPCCLVLQTGQEVLVTDLAADLRWSPAWRDRALANGLRSVLSTVVRGAGGVPLATFVMYRREPGNPEPVNPQIGFVARQLIAIAIERDQADTDLRQAEADARLLQTLGAELLSETGEETLYQRVIEGAARLMRSQFASMQSVEAGRDGGTELRLLASRGFSPLAQDYWSRVRCDQHSACARSLKTGMRTLIPDIETCAFLAGTADLGVYREARIRAVQTTPLVSRAGNTVGMLSTHWDRPYAPPERDLRNVDILARQAADLIERKRNEEALRESDRRKDEFLATLAHELRNPLAPMRNSLTVLKMSDRAPDTLEDRLRNVMDRQLQHLIRLVDDLLDVSRISRGTMQLRREPVELATIVAHAVETSQPLADQNQHEIVVALPPEPIWLHADPVRLAQVFNNLMNNACKYTDPGGHVWLSAERHGEEVVVRVRDTGLGIPSERLRNIFDMFHQVNRSIERRQGGLGIGLSLVRRLVELHGGSVLANSEGPGHGSEFVVRLPILKPASESARPPQPRMRLLPSRAVAAGGPRRALVVDDNVDSADSLATLLRVSGHEAVVAHDGVEAVEAAERYRPEVVFLDIGMPRMNGYDAARRIRQESWGRGMVLVAVTGWGKDEDRRRSRDAGFDAHLVKPADTSELLRLLGSLTPAAGRHEVV